MKRSHLLSRRLWLSLALAFTLIFARGSLADAPFAPGAPLSRAGGGLYGDVRPVIRAALSPTLSDCLNAAGELPLTDKGAYYALCLPDSVWDDVADIFIAVLIDDGEGYIDLGRDDSFTFDDDGDLIASFSQTWVAIDGNIVCFYAQEYTQEGAYFRYTGYTPVLLNGEMRELVLHWVSDAPEAFVAGARPLKEKSVEPEDLQPLRAGDVIRPLCDYYLYDGTFDDVYAYGGAFAVTENPAVSYEDISRLHITVWYELLDASGTLYVTESLAYGE